MKKGRELAALASHAAPPWKKTAKDLTAIFYWFLWVMDYREMPCDLDALAIRDLFSSFNWGR